MTAVTYSSTEKKRIRKSFAKRQAVLNVPFLLATQLEEEAPLALVRPGFGARRESGSQGVLFA